MKKVFIKRTVLAALGIFLLGGCASDQKNQEPQTENKTLENEILETGTLENGILENQTSESVSWEDERAENESSSTIGNKAVGSVPTIVITNENKKWYTEDGEQLLLEADVDRVEAIGDGFEALNTALSEQWGGLRDDYDELEMARDHYDSLNAENDYFMNYYISEGVVVYRLDDCVVSFCGMYDAYTGGAHGYYGFDGATFDIQSGKKLQLEDILSDAEGFYDKAVSYIIEKLDESYGDALFSNYKEVVETETFGEMPVCWYLDRTGIVIEYGLYSVVPYVAGAPEVTLPYDEFAEYIKEDYLKPCSSFVARVEINEDFSRLIGETGKVMLSSVYSDEYSDAEVTVVSGDASKTVGTFGRVMNSYVIRREDGRSFLIFYCDYASDDFVTYVYEVTGGAVRECDKLDGAEWNNTCVGTDRIGLSMHLDVLGTYAGQMVYRLDDDGNLIQTEEIFAIDAPFELTVVKGLPVTLEGEETTIPAGSKIKITGTDNAGTAYFQLDTGETGAIQYVRDDEQWQLLIDGVSENEYFEMVPYAG